MGCGPFCISFTQILVESPVLFLLPSPMVKQSALTLTNLPGNVTFVRGSDLLIIYGLDER